MRRQNNRCLGGKYKKIIIYNYILSDEVGLYVQAILRTDIIMSYYYYENLASHMRTNSLSY